MSPSRQIAACDRFRPEEIIKRQTCSSTVFTPEFVNTALIENEGNPTRGADWRDTEPDFEIASEGELFDWQARRRLISGVLPATREPIFWFGYKINRQFCAEQTIERNPRNGFPIPSANVVLGCI